MTSRGWKVEVRTGPAGLLHASWPSTELDPRSRAVAVCEPEGPCVVLGSTQPEDAADRAHLEAQGVALARRRTGGGAVYVDAADPVWIDLWLPADDPLAVTDVGRSFDWLGDAWVAALDALGARGVSSHRDRPTRTRWSSLVCFAAVGRGEVLDAAGRKVVGLAQRRTRHGSWYQSDCLLVRGTRVHCSSPSPSPHPTAWTRRRELASVAIGVAALIAEPPPGATLRTAITTSLLEALP